MTGFCSSVTPDIPQSEVAATHFYDSGGSLAKNWANNWANFALLCRMTTEISPKIHSHLRELLGKAQLLQVASSDLSEYARREDEIRCLQGVYEEHSDRVLRLMRQALLHEANMKVKRGQERVELGSVGMGIMGSSFVGPL